MVKGAILKKINKEGTFSMSTRVRKVRINTEYNKLEVMNQNRIKMMIE